MSRDAVTTDLKVLQGWPQTGKGKKQRLDVCCSASDVAAALGLTPFQITARLKGMEGRGLVVRDKAGLWSLTQTGQTERENPSPTLLAAANPSRAPKRIKGEGLPAIGLPDDSKVPRVGSTRIDEGWRLKYNKDVGADTLNAPDGREYVKARPHEAADLIIDRKHDDGWDYSMFTLPRWRLLAGSKVQTKARLKEREQERRAEAKEEKVQKVESPTTHAGHRRKLRGKAKGKK